MANTILSKNAGWSGLSCNCPWPTLLRASCCSVPSRPGSSRRVSQPKPISCPPAANGCMRAKAFTEARFDVCEISFSNTVTAVSKGDFPYALIPVFLSRAFRHSSLFIRTDRGIACPEDLRGKTVGLQEYDMTAAVVVRGFLRDRHGVDPRDITWKVRERERTKPLEFPLGRPPGGVHIEILPPGPKPRGSATRGGVGRRDRAAAARRLAERPISFHGLLMCMREFAARRAKMNAILRKNHMVDAAARAAPMSSNR
jgi:hypothetical protein